MRVLALDVESGGLDPATDAIIQLGCVVWEHGEIARAEWVINDPEGHLDPEALKVNGFTPESILRLGRRPHDVWGEFRRFVNQHCGTDPVRVVPCGQNVYFDLLFVRRLARLANCPDPRAAVEGLIGRRPLDTISAARFLQYAGVLWPDFPCSLSSMTEAFLRDLNLGPQRHTAADDAWRTAMILDALEMEMRRYRHG